MTRSKKAGSVFGKPDPSPRGELCSMPCMRTHDESWRDLALLDSSVRESRSCAIPASCIPVKSVD
jgi:hypothetical protein